MLKRKVNIKSRGGAERKEKDIGEIFFCESDREIDWFTSRVDVLV